MASARTWYHVNRITACVSVFLLTLSTGFSQQAARAQAVTDDQILDTIKKQVDYLLSQKQVDNWEPKEKFGGDWFDAHGGQTSMVMYALLYAGRCIDDKRLDVKSTELKPAAQWISQLKPTYTYAAAMQINALALIPDVMKNPQYRVPLSRAAQLLVDNVGAEGTYSYTWNYPVTHLPVHWRGKNDPKGDNSNGQYGLLGVWVAQDVGFEVPENYWPNVNGHWTKSQNADGGWGYTENQEHDSYLNMSTAGLASLYITTECVDLSPPRLEGVPNAGLDNGLAWVEKNFEAREDAYGLYGCERVGLASGRKYFGTTNWYQAGAAAIIAAQNGDGGSGLHVKWTHDNISATAYALLFLCRGRNPVLFNKLEYYDPKDPKRLFWDARPRDLANLAHQYGKIFEHDFNWHVVNLHVPAEDWLDSPVLLITGCEDPHFTPEDIAKLKTFVNDGGTIFSTDNGAKPEFTAAIKKYASQMVDGLYEMRELPKDHVLFKIQNQINNLPHMMGMSNGIRELWVHSPTDMGASWQMRALSHKSDWDFPANLYLYATGKVNSREKFPDLVVKPGNGGAHAIALARIDYAGNWDPEPGAWPRMAKLASSQFNTNLQITNAKIADLDFKKTPVAHLTGTAGFSLNTDDVDLLRKYLEAGGTLLVDAGGGAETFNSSFAKLAEQLYPKDALDDIPPDSLLISGKMPDGIDTTNVDFRRSTLKKRGKPPLQGIKQNGRYVIIYSPLDLTSGLLGTNTWGILGFAPDSAQAVLRNMLLFAAQPPAK